MKKLIFALMLACVAVGANAQAYLGGTLGLSIQNTKETLDYGNYGHHSNSITTTTFTLAPEIGYSFNKVLAVGTTFGLDCISVDSESVTGFFVLPYLRATFARAGKFDFFAEATVGYEFYNEDEYNYNSFMLGLRPGFRAHLNDKVSLIARSTLIGYEKIDGVSQTSISLFNNFSVGILFNL